MNLGTETVLSQNAARQYKITGTDRSRSAEKLSSGYRINRAADDAAGLSISEKMRKQIRGLDKASQNIDDGLSYVQVADGALAEVQSMMHRLNELSIQAANDTNTAADRLAIDNEVQDLKTEINRVFETTEFNTKKIWDTNGNDKVQIGIDKVPAVTSPYRNTNQQYSISEANKWLQPGNHSYNIAADENGVTVSWTAFDGNTYSTTTMPWPSDDMAGQSLDFEIGKYLDTATYPALANSGINFHLKYNISDVASKQDVIDSINGTSMSFGVVANTNAKLSTDNGGTYQSSYTKNGVTLYFESQINYPAQLASDRKFVFGQTDTVFMEPDVSDPDNFKNPFSNSNWNDAGNWKMDFTMGQNATNPNAQATTSGTFSGNGQSSSTYYHGTTSEPNNPPDPTNPSSRYWWNYNTYHQPYYSNHQLPNNNGTPTSVNDALCNPDSLNYALNNTQNGGTIGVTIPISSIPGYTVGGQAYTSIGSLTMYLDAKPTTTLDDIKDLLNDVTGVDISATGLGRATNYGTFVNTITLDKPIYESKLNIKIQTSDVAYDHMSIAYKSLRLDNLGLKQTNTLTHDDAEAAIASTADALAIVSEQRSLFGAYQNRLESAHSTVENTGENVQNAESRLRDTDMAAEMVNNSRTNILAQAGEAIMAQSNSRLNQIVTLLQESF